MLLFLKTKKLKSLTRNDALGGQQTKQIGGGNTDTITRPIQPPKPELKVK
ncbi:MULTISPECIES: hypothetical protein [Pseudoalteromonas]|uniref:Uncharacterized protein n=1 Tax=Pseudoalteromonas obscura TaxID=3048491 RepID=A0ABT7ERU9_9GAMM|nr:MULTISPECIES: hypothetical protein [Pseudoalteromonas]MBQ4839868.1 hypothetical protein [Pseudoalteromonas luteoviolacea]MDK2597795.1 hypothetical protein [Pseudoalteromonas sp. P94(2023)]